MKKLLIVTPFFPYPLTSGGHQAMFNGIYAIKDDFDISLAYVVDHESTYLSDEKAFLERLPNVQLYPLFYRSNWAQRLMKYFRRFISSIKQQSPDTLGTYWVSGILPIESAFQNHVISVCSRCSFDIIQVEMTRFIPLVLSLPENTKNIFVHHELGFVRRGLELAHSNKSAYLKSCKAFADMNEIGLLNLYDRIITLSSIDKQKLIDVGINTPISNSFAVVQPSQEFTFVPCEDKVLSFIGPDVHTPNFVGMTWFLENCWAKLKAFDNDYRLNIIGKWENNHVKDYGERYPDVHFLGFVPDLQSVLKGSIMIVPITVGSGIRMKILEACSNGVPIVSTMIGAEGIPLKSGIDGFITDDPNEFVDDIIRLQNPDLQKQFVFNAYNMVQENYSLEALRKNRLAIYKEVLGQE